MKVKMKVKHLFMIGVGFLLLVPFVIFIVQPQVQLFVGKQQLEKGEGNGKEHILQALESSILPGQKWDVIETYMLDDGMRSRFDVYVGPGTSQINHAPNGERFLMEEKLPYLKEYLEAGPVNGYLNTVAKQLAHYYQREGDSEKADEVLKQAIGRFSKNTGNREELMIERVQMLMKQANYSKAKEMVAQLKKEISYEQHYWRAELTRLEAEIIIQGSQVEQAYEMVVAQIKEYEKQLEKERQLFPELEESTPVVLEQLKSLKNHLEHAMKQQKSGVATVKGQLVRSDGTPVSNAGVFLRDEDHVYRSVGDGEPYQMITDEQGYFEFTGVIPGNYQLFLGLNFEQIDGWTWPVQYGDWLEVEAGATENLDVVFHPLIELQSPVNQEEITKDHVTFVWEEVKGAAYYHLSLGVEIEGGSIGSAFKGHIKDNELTVPIEELYNQTVGMTFEDTEDWNSVDPNSILAFTNTENRFFWSVEAFDYNGKKMTGSNGYRLNEDSIGNLPFFYLKEREMTEADRLFLDGKVEQAFQQYQASYEENQEDHHSLRMIVRLMGVEAAQTGKTRNEAVLPYFIQWAEVSQSAEDAISVAHIFYENRDWAEYHKWYDQYLQLSNHHPSHYLLGIHATALMKQGEIEAATPIFQQAMELDPENRFIGHWLAAEMYSGKSFESILALAKKYPERGSIGNKTDWVSIVQKLSLEAEGNPEFRKDLNVGLQLYFNDQQVQLDTWLRDTNQQTRVFFTALQRVK